MPYAYRKSERLRKNREFTRVMKQGKRLSADGLSLFYAENSGTDFRIGIATARKLANPAVRNRLRRQVRSSIQAALAECAAGVDLVFVVRKGMMGQEFNRIRKAVQELLSKSGICKQEHNGPI